MPPISSGLVSFLTKITSPCLAIISALLEERTILPNAAPGEAGRPLLNNIFVAVGSILGCKTFSTISGSILSKACCLVNIPSCIISKAIFIVACAVLLPDLVCNIQHFPFSIVNSTSCMSL